MKNLLIFIGLLSLPLQVHAESRSTEYSDETAGDMADLADATKLIKAEQQQHKKTKMRKGISASDQKKLNGLIQKIQPEQEAGYTDQNRAEMTDLVKSVLAEPVHLTGRAQENYCHANTVDTASFSRCVSLPPVHDYGCGIPTRDGVYFESNEGACKKLERGIASESTSRKNPGFVGAAKEEESISGNSAEDAK